MYASISDNIQQEIISKVDDAFIFYHIVLIYVWFQELNMAAHLH